MNLPATADIFIPDGLCLEAALERVTHLGIGAHQDDLEFMAFHGIVECFGRHDLRFGGVTCTDGGGSVKAGSYANFTNEDMREARRREQRAAAEIGGYAAMIQLDYSSAAVKSPTGTALRDNLLQILSASCPRVVYTHNPADRHETHLGVLIAALEAMRLLPRADRPEQVIGCELWGSLDWLPAARKVAMNVSGRENLAASLNGVFESQIAGGKRYDLAISGRRSANAVLSDSHSADQAEQVIFGVDLTPLVHDESLDLLEHTLNLVQEFQADVRARLAKRLGV